MPAPTPSTHSEHRFHDPKDWVLYLAHAQPRRLVVFVHGFRGKAVRSWQQFPGGGERSSWWRESDLLFVDYPSQLDDLTGTANRLRRQIPTFYPELSKNLLCTEGVAVRDPTWNQYDELFLVGHSLGGMIIRRALSDLADEWLADLAEDPNRAMPTLLEAQVRLFSPASAGFRPGGFLAFLRSGPTWPLLEAKLRFSTAFTDLQPSSPILRETRARTEKAASGPEAGRLKALRPDLLWANPDQVVLSERYDTDRSSDSEDGTTHRSVCKPRGHYEVPWIFVETGRKER